MFGLLEIISGIYLTIVGVISWVLLASLAGAVAEHKGRVGWGYVVLSLLLSPLVGLVIIALLPAKENVLAERAITSGAARICNHCFELVKVNAKVCKHCQRDLSRAAA